MTIRAYASKGSLHADPSRKSLWSILRAARPFNGVRMRADDHVFLQAPIRVWVVQKAIYLPYLTDYSSLVFDIPDVIYLDVLRRYDPDLYKARFGNDTLWKARQKHTRQPPSKERRPFLNEGQVCELVTDGTYWLPLKEMVELLGIDASDGDSPAMVQSGLGVHGVDAAAVRDYVHLDITPVVPYILKDWREILGNVEPTK